MSKFIERAKTLMAQLDLFRDKSPLSAECRIHGTHERVEYETAVYDRDQLIDCILDVRILISEFNCPPLYEACCEAIASRMDVTPKLIRLLRKLIETEEFRRLSDG